MALITEAIADVDRSGDRFYAAELYRLKGELLLAQEGKEQEAKIETNPRPLIPDPQGEVEACFLKAIEIAQKQQAKSLELRAVMSLVRLRQQQALGQSAKSKEVRAGNTEQGVRTTLDEEHSMLSEVYNWFTEGFDTKDLQEAKGLLEKLARETLGNNDRT